MFAVKGWNVDASALKPQTQVFKKAPALDENGEEKTSKKRKRGDGANIQSEDVGKMWERHVEGKEPKKPTKKEKKEKKRQKMNEDGAVEKATMAEVQQKPETTSQVDAGAQEDKLEKPAKAEKKKEKKRKEKASLQQDSPNTTSTTKASAPSAVPPLPPGAKLTPMQSAMRQKLTSARFRHLNQTLYTEPSVKALELFAQNPEMFEDYHSGFRQQVAIWPENPVDTFIATIRARGSVKLPSQKNAFKSKSKKPNEVQAVEEAGDNKITPLPRTQGTAIIADLGCGDARLAHTIKSSNEGQKLQVKVLSYDLHSPSSLVTKADISNIPTADGSVDVAIFCLALMGTNWISFIEEAYRILHWKGELWVAEIKSRFGRVGRAGKPVEHSVGGKRKQAALKKVQEAKKREQEEVNEDQALAVEVDGVETQNQETDVSAFVDVLKRRGFLLKNGESSIDLSNKMFVKMEFVKAAPATKGKNVQGQQGSKPAERFKKSKMKFLEEKEDEIATDDEAKVLKPCLYKIR